MSDTRSVGKPKKFESGEELISLWRDFCNEIAQAGYTVTPTQTSFCRWLTQHHSEADRKTIYNYLNEYFPNVKKEFERIRSDTVVEGTMLGKYNATMSIFALKNWCDWKDKQEIEQDITAKGIEVKINVID